MAKEKEKMPTAKERYMKRIKDSNPDLDMENEDAFYENANQRMDDYERLNEGMNNIRKTMDENPYFAEMIYEASRNKELDPIIYMIEKGNIDLDALANDEDYATKIAEARAKWLDEHTKAKELEDKIAENLPTSIAACQEKGKELGLSDEETEKVISRYFSLLDDIEQGILATDVFELLAKGDMHDADVEEASKQGEAKGRATKIRETLATMPKQSPRNGGVQAGNASEPQERDEDNMFGI